MTEATMNYDFEAERYKIGKYDLHCGDCFEVYVSGSWQSTRIEYNHGTWYLIGDFQHCCMDGMRARI